MCSPCPPHSACAGADLSPRWGTLGGDDGGELPRQFRNQSRTALAGKIGPEPLGLYAHAVLQLRQRHQMKEDPHEPGDEPTRAKKPALQDGEVLADDCHVALVDVVERAL